MSRGTIKRFGVAMCTGVALAGALAAPRLAQAGGWIADPSSECRVWNPNPESGESIKWLGSCANGLAEGHGIAQWFRSNIPIETDEGDWREGRQTGKGSQSWSSGRYDGELADGEPNGRGVLTLPKLRYDGEFRNGRPNGVGTMTNGKDIYQGTWKEGCFQDDKRKAAIGVPISSCR
jgi:hypothetical protein